MRKVQIKEVPVSSLFVCLSVCISFSTSASSSISLSVSVPASVSLRLFKSLTRSIWRSLTRILLHKVKAYYILRNKGQHLTPIAKVLVATAETR